MESDKEMVSYARKCDAYFKVIQANPKISAAELGRRYAGTKYAMRKQDRLDFVRLAKQQISEGEAFKKQLQNSNLPDPTKKKMDRIIKQTAYKYAKNETRKAKAKQTVEQINASMSDLKARTLNRLKPGKGDFLDFGY